MTSPLPSHSEPASFKATSSSDPTLRSGFRAYEPPRRKEYAVKPLLPDKPSTGAHFIPNTLHDVVFTSLHLQVFEEDARSATPIAHLLRERLSDARVYALIESSRRYKLGVGKPQRLPATMFVFEQEIESEETGGSQLRLEMEEARQVHATRLRDAGMVDVNVLYSAGEAVVATFKDDMAALRSLGGILYHMWPHDQKTRTLGLSAIVEPETLARLYPPERMDDGGIEIHTNTTPASRHTRSTPLFKENIFPYVQWRASPPRQGTLAEDEVKQQRDAITQEVDRILGGRSRAFSLEAIAEAEKGKDIHVKSFSCDQVDICPQFDRPFGSGPFINRLPTHDDAWWMADHAIRKKDIDAWDRATWKEITVGPRKGQWGRQTSDVPPEQAIAGVDFPLVPEMCSEYVADRNYKWHEEHIAKPDRAERRRALREAEKRLETQLQIARYNEAMRQQAQQAYVAERARLEGLGQQPDARLSMRMEQLQLNQRAIDEDLERRRLDIMKLRRDSGYLGAGVGAALFGDDADGTEEGAEPAGQGLAEQGPEDLQARRRQQRGFPVKRRSELRPGRAVSRPAERSQQQQQITVSQRPARQAAASLADIAESVADIKSIVDDLEAQRL